MQLGPDIARDLDQDGFARVPHFLDDTHCHQFAQHWEDRTRFRNEIVMEHKGYGEGVYRYFAAPLPQDIQALRETLYAQLVPIANDWHERLGIKQRFAPDLDAFLAQCAAEDQARPTPLLLRYERGGYNRLHQDRYGEVAFPLQVVILLSSPDPGNGTGDFAGGEFLLTEGRVRMQSRGTSISLERGEALVIPNQIRPIQGKRGAVRAQVRHGVSTVTRGVRMALGMIFHDAA